MTFELAVTLANLSARKSDRHVGPTKIFVGRQSAHMSVGVKKITDKVWYGILGFNVPLDTV